MTVKTALQTVSSKQQVIFSFYWQFKNLEASYCHNSENMSPETKLDSYKKSGIITT